MRNIHALLAKLGLFKATLLAGFLTPIMAFIALGVQALALSRLHLDCAALNSIAPVEALALAMLGPGAYSIHAYLFGRRVVVLPPHD